MCNNGLLLLVRLHLINMFLQHVTVTLGVHFEGVVCYNRTTFRDRLFDVGNISAMFFSCLFPKCGIRIGGILKIF